MSRRKTTQVVSGVNLFPFLSILACLIGILTIVIKLLSDIQAEETSGLMEEELELAMAMQSVRVEMRKREEELEVVREELAAKSSVSAEYQKLLDRRRALQAQMDGVDVDALREIEERLREQIEELEKQVVAFKSERPEIEERIQILKDEIESRKEDPDGEPVPVVVTPGGTGQAGGTRLYFVECNADGIVILNHGDRATQVAISDIGESQAVMRLFRHVRRENDAMILFLLRRDGNPAYLRAGGLAEVEYELTIGKLPVPTEGKIDLSAFGL